MEALDTYVIRGVTSNINFLRALLDHPRFIEGTVRFGTVRYGSVLVTRYSLLATRYLFCLAWLG